MMRVLAAMQSLCANVQHVVSNIIPGKFVLNVCINGQAPAQATSSGFSPAKVRAQSSNNNSTAETVSGCLQMGVAGHVYWQHVQDGPCWESTASRPA
jgi:hypothetical protein